MESVLKRMVGPYTLTGTAYDQQGDSAQVSAPVSCTVFDADGVELFSGEPTITYGKLVMAVENAILPSAGVYSVRWAGVVGGVAYEWETYFELIEVSGPDYDTYTAQGGSLDEDAFTSHLIKATAIVDEAIWPNEVTLATRAAYERAICAVVDVLASTPEITTESVGNTSVTYAAPEALSKVITRHLKGTGLLYRGL